MKLRYFRNAFPGKQYIRFFRLVKYPTCIALMTRWFDVAIFYRSYQHIWQYSAACVNLTGHYTRPAKLAEYTPLMEELTSLGYDLRVAHRASRKDYEARVRACEVAK